MVLFRYPPLPPVSISPTPIEYNLNGVATIISENTTTPSLSRPLPVKELSPFCRAFAKLDMAVTNVTAAAYVQLLASTGATTISKVQIFMSSGEPLYLAFGAAASEVNQMIIIPGGTGIIDVTIPPSTRLSVKVVTAATTVNSGVILINLLG